MELPAGAIGLIHLQRLRHATPSPVGARYPSRALCLYPPNLSRGHLGPSLYISPEASRNVPVTYSCVLSRAAGFGRASTCCPHCTLPSGLMAPANAAYALFAAGRNFRLSRILLLMPYASPKQKKPVPLLSGFGTSSASSRLARQKPSSDWRLINSEAMRR